ncbi:hypothetical protein [Pseudomonas sp. HS6]|uniref:hypothetical protein n=1 Tax=Pseudomonas sp. HS6 TaxID=2850559 RepID=UPI002019751C|nr:hypothetical protein [Pseudomonas sp. HS6]UQS12710.1 hypothetical protein JJN09_15890 [Pseudomonas sp. HS6]
MFEDVVSVQRLEVKFDSAPTLRHKQLYANGRMQVRVLVLVSGGDAQANEVSLHGHRALQTLRLISYNGARPLSGDWKVETRENRYAHDMSGGIARATALVPTSHNRITDPADPLQVYEFWVTSTKPGSLQIAAEITLGDEVIRSNGQSSGGDSSVTLEAISPVQYPLSHFSLEKVSERIVDRFDAIHRYNLGLNAGQRSIHLLEWASTKVQKDDDDATLFFASGNIDDSHSGGRTYCGYMAPVYGVSATIRGPKGYVGTPVNQQPGKLTVLSYLSPDYQHQRVQDQDFALTVFDEFGTAHWIQIKPNLSGRSFKLA